MSTRPYDTIIVGARCAGASTALLLARRGCRVLLVDRARFPSDIPHGHMIHRDGPRRLRDWGLLASIVEAGTPPVTRVSSYLGDFVLTAQNLEIDGVAWGYGPRRRIVDDLLVRAAVAAGAEFRDGVRVERLITERGRVAGIRARTGGTTFEERATLTIGADGRHSPLAAMVGAPVYGEVAPLLCYYFSYWSGVPCDGLEIYDVDGRLGFAFPTNDSLFAAFMAWPVSMFHEVRADIERHFLAAADRFPGYGARLRAGRREERFVGAADLPTFYRRPYGDGWALVGDAGYHKDPYMALGMSDALRDAELLATAIDSGLSGREPLPDALAGYERLRNEASKAAHDENLMLARMAPKPPDLLALRARLRGNAAQATRFWMARTGMIPPDAFWNPDNLAQLEAGTAA